MSALAKDEVQVWWLRTDAVPAELLPRYEALLDQEERTAVARLKFAADRQLQLGAHALLRVALAAAGPLAAADWRFARTPGGKPALAPRQQGPHFNITHTRGLAACALAWGSELGVDAEHERGGDAPFELCPTVFTPRERSWLAELPEKARGSAFFGLWTLKEAYMKAVGLGLELPPRSLEASLEPPQVTAAGRTGTWRFAALRPTNEHRLALAVAARPGLRRLRLRECVPLHRTGAWCEAPLSPPIV